MRAAEADAQHLGVTVESYLSAASEKCDQFARSREMHDRAGIVGALTSVLHRNGQLVLFLGDKSVGKSLLLWLARTDTASGGPRDMTVIIDARKCGTNLADGLAAELASAVREETYGTSWLGSHRNSNEVASNKRLLDLAAALWASFSVSGKLDVPGGVTELALSTKPISNIDALNRLVAAAIDLDVKLNLVFDEGNIAFPTPSQTGRSGELPPSKSQQVALEASRGLLNRLVELTKQSRFINAVIVTSENGWPFRLRHNNFFNTGNFTRVIYAGEVAPAAMRILLTERWGLGQRLSDVFLAYYGGHVHTAINALFALSSELGAFEVQSVTDLNTPSSIQQCLLKGDPTSMGLMLHDMAECGMASADDVEGVDTRLVSDYNVGGLVPSAAAMSCVSAAVRATKATVCGIVPSTQFSRHLIAKALYAAKVAADAKASMRRL